MPDKTRRLPENPAGSWYVDAQCIDCDLCRQVAPGNFTRNAEAGYSFVSRQPATPEEEQQCRHAQADCPVEAIGSDGA